VGTFSGPDFTEDPHPRQLSKRGWSLLGVTALIVVVIYWLVVSFYSSEGGSSFESEATVNRGGISINFEPIGVSPDTSNASFRMVMSSDDETISDADGRAVDNIRVTVGGPDGSQEIRIPQGTAFGRAEVVLGVAGELAQYPFDSYSGVYFVNADFYDRQTGGVNETKGAIPLEVTSVGAINGWNSALGVSSTGSFGVGLSADFDRAFSTKLFALVLLALAALTSLLALFISVLVLSNRRKVEAALLAWTGSLLFALPILRTYLPGAPPIGAAIDIYVFLWTVVMAFIAVFFIAASWVGQRGAELETVYTQEEVSTNAT
jgi:hypothetical protein